MVIPKPQCQPLFVRNNMMPNNIKQLRVDHDITQEELARRVGVRRETIVFLEQGKYNPSLKLAHSVAKALKTTIPILFNLK